ncbi:MAG TPA: cobalamin-dependent protein [Candidatus Magasanikbacteria bacterium]|nr:cobalamin-dependent protein [Candidatus Magasanikbacteria bacterium]
MKRKIERFVIITPRAVSPAGTPPRIHPPLGAISVLAEAKRNGYEVFLFDAAAEGLKKSILNSSYNPVEIEELDGIFYWKTGLRIEEIVAEVIKLEPDVIGMSCCTVVDRGEVAKTATAIKKALPVTPIILGGHEATQWYEEILGNTPFPIEKIPAIDYVVVGPGQSVIISLLCYLDESVIGNLSQGVACRFNGRVKFSGVSEFHPDHFAIPDYSLLPRVKVAGRKKALDIYSFVGNPHAGRIGTILSIQGPVAYLPLLTSYGCGFDCSFCDTDKQLVRYAVENIMKIINEFDSLFGIDYIDFMDNNFGGGNIASRILAFEILSQVADAGYQIGFSNGLTFESMVKENFRLLRRFSYDGNVRHIAFPCENGNDRVLRMIRKPHTLSVVRKVLEFAKENLQMTNREGFFIGGFPKTNGQPAESPRELERTFQFITECIEQRFLHQAIFLTLSPVTREYRRSWRQLYPTAPFEHCLFSRKTGVWPYPNELLDEMHRKVKFINEHLGRSVTRRL